MCSQSDDSEKSFEFLNENSVADILFFAFCFFSKQRTGKCCAFRVNIFIICARDLWYTRSWCWLFITRNTPKREEAPLKRKGTITRAT